MENKGFIRVQNLWLQDLSPNEPLIRTETPLASGLESE